MNPAVKGEFNSALRDLKRSGIKPLVTSTWRSSERQAELHRCSRSKRCRRANPGLYYAKPAGSSLHEAGFAVDISGIASGPRGAKRLTPRGRRIVRVMQKNGFKWRYGLADPAHFEADPKRHGYRSASQAINLSQSKCQVRLISGKKKADRKSSRALRQISRSGRPGSHRSRG
ncbi:MAG TPA: D-alanyl-D-alanine carboxypeptidase family protein [Blastocatellia bacterium]|nr:D-alanyl-D-alanine carboxypeptidase family protein [Blastocatellia bacterium]